MTCIFLEVNIYTKKNFFFKKKEQKKEQIKKRKRIQVLIILRAL